MYTANQAIAKPVLLIMGDSLSAAYGISSQEGWVALLAQRMQKDNYIYKIINASTSGATTADGLRRLPTLISENQPKIVVLALGSNDGLRGQPIINMKNNLSKMIKDSQAANAKVLLIGFHLPYNYGESFRQEFAQVFPDLAYEYDTALVPFLLDGFANDLNYFQSDQLHPSAKAQPLMLNNVWPHLQPLLAD